jgi:hypothetical protein
MSVYVLYGVKDGKLLNIIDIIKRIGDFFRLPMQFLECSLPWTRDI